VIRLDACPLLYLRAVQPAPLAGFAAGLRLVSDLRMAWLAARRAYCMQPGAGHPAFLGDPL
jgi:hypothetical protein